MLKYLVLPSSIKHAYDTAWIEICILSPHQDTVVSYPFESLVNVCSADVDVDGTFPSTLTHTHS